MSDEKLKADKITKEKFKAPKSAGKGTSSKTPKKLKKGKKGKKTTFTSQDRMASATARGFKAD